MVKEARAGYRIAAPVPKKVLGTGIRLSEVLGKGVRFEASAFNLEARAVVDRMQASGLPLIPLYGDDGLCREAHNAFRFRRVWVNEAHGIPFLSSSDIISMRPQPKGFLSRKHTKRLSELLIKPWDVLISRSGTIGNVGLAAQSTGGMALSEHVIRLRASDPTTAGYVTAFLRGRYGRLQLGLATYGSVVQHVEPDHLRHLLIPDLDPIRRAEIGTKVLQAYKWRDRANALLDEADEQLHERLGLPRLTRSSADGPSVSTVRASALRWRFEGSFHQAAVQTAERNLARVSTPTLPLGDPTVSDSIRAVTKFRKRTYVPRDGILLLSSKQLFQIDPVDVKQLGRGLHKKDMSEIGLVENTIAVTCSGTIGRVQIIPGYMDGWAANQHAIRITASKDLNAGYLYAWLASDYGATLIKRYSYGSVILEIDRFMLAEIPVPLPGADVESEIGKKVLEANRLRSDAWYLERSAITGLEDLIGR